MTTTTRDVTLTHEQIALNIYHDPASHNKFLHTLADAYTIADAYIYAHTDDTKPRARGG